MMDFHVLLYLRYMYRTEPTKLWEHANVKRIIGLSDELRSVACTVYITEV